MKKGFVTAITALILIVFNACSVQTTFDIYDVCERFNSLEKEKILNTDMFLSDGEGSLYCFYKIGESTALISAAEDDNSAVKSIGVTISADGFNEANRAEILKLLEDIFGAFNYGNTKIASGVFEQLNIGEKTVFFKDNYCQIDMGKTVYTLFSDKYSFTLTEETVNLAD